MKRLSLSLFVGIAFAGGFANSSSANDWATQIWAGGDVYKSIGDRVTNIAGGPGGLTNSFGNVFGFNTGLGLGNSRVRFQVGASYSIYDYKGRLAIIPNAYEPEKQLFFTAGLSKRGDMQSPVSWGIVYDAFHAEQWGVNANEIDLGQVRAMLGIGLKQGTEIGLWGTYKTNDDQARVTVAGGGPFSTIHAMNQANFYLKQNFANGAQLTGYAGVFARDTVGEWQFGLLGQAPLGANWSAYGNFNYVVTNSGVGAGGSGTEQFNVSFGVAYAFGGKAPGPRGGVAGLPLLNVANNGSFLVTD